MCLCAHTHACMFVFMKSGYMLKAQEISRAAVQKPCYLIRNGFSNHSTHTSLDTLGPKHGFYIYQEGIKSSVYRIPFLYTHLMDQQMNPISLVPRHLRKCGWRWMDRVIKRGWNKFILLFLQSLNITHACVCTHVQLIFIYSKREIVNDQFKLSRDVLVNPT